MRRYLYHTKTGFTLVELVIILTVVAILSAVGFMSYAEYTSTSRDATRLADINTLYTALNGSISSSGSLPMPESSISITNASGAIVAYQGVVGTTLLSDLGIEKGGRDPKNGTHYTYSRDKSGKRSAILGFFESDGYDDKLSLSPFERANAATVDRSELYPASSGDKIGSFVASGSNTPIQEVYTTTVSLATLATDNVTIVNTCATSLPSDNVSHISLTTVEDCFKGIGLFTLDATPTISVDGTTGYGSGTEVPEDETLAYTGALAGIETPNNAITMFTTSNTWTQYWTALCSAGTMQVIDVSPGTDTIPATLVANRVYRLGPGTYTLTRGVTTGACSGIVGYGSTKPTIVYTGTVGTTIINVAGIGSILHYVDITGTDNGNEGLTYGVYTSSARNTAVSEVKITNLRTRFGLYAATGSGTYRSIEVSRLRDQTTSLYGIYITAANAKLEDLRVSDIEIPTTGISSMSIFGIAIVQTNSPNTIDGAYVSNISTSALSGAVIGFQVAPSANTYGTGTIVSNVVIDGIKNIGTTLGGATGMYVYRAQGHQYSNISVNDLHGKGNTTYGFYVNSGTTSTYENIRTTNILGMRTVSGVNFTSLSGGIVRQIYAGDIKSYGYYSTNLSTIHGVTFASGLNSTGESITIENLGEPGDTNLVNGFYISAQTNSTFKNIRIHNINTEGDLTNAMFPSARGIYVIGASSGLRFTNIIATNIGGLYQGEVYGIYVTSPARASVNNALLLNMGGTPGTSTRYAAGIINNSLYSTYSNVVIGNTGWNPSGSTGRLGPGIGVRSIIATASSTGTFVLSNYSGYSFSGTTATSTNRGIGIIASGTGIINKTQIFNSGYGYYAGAGATGKWYGDVRLFSNAITTTGPTASGSSADFPGIFSNGTLATTGTYSTADMVLPNVSGWDAAATGPQMSVKIGPNDTFTYGSNLPNQIQPVEMDATGNLTTWGVDGTDYNTSKKIGEW